MSGIRPKLQGPGERRPRLRDRARSRPAACPGFVNLIGIDSPGLTSAPAIARYVAGLVGSS